MHLFRYTHAKSDFMKKLQDEIKTSVVTCTHTHIYESHVYIDSRLCIFMLYL